MIPLKYSIVLTLVIRIMQDMRWLCSQFGSD